MEMILAGERVARDRSIEVLDPFDGSLIDTVPAATTADVQLAVAGAVEGYRLRLRLALLAASCLFFFTPG